MNWKAFLGMTLIFGVLWVITTCSLAYGYKLSLTILWGIVAIYWAGVEDAPDGKYYSTEEYQLAWRIRYSGRK